MKNLNYDKNLKKIILEKNKKIILNENKKIILKKIKKIIPVQGNYRVRKFDERFYSFVR